MPKVADRSPAREMVREIEGTRAFALSQEERDLCQNVTVFGAVWLRQNRGWTQSRITEFLERKEVALEINTLSKQYEDRTGIQERTQFFAQLKVNSMVPAAITILARALQGAKQKEDGTVMSPPSRQQFEAAIEVMDRANIQGTKFGGTDQTPAIDARSVQIAIGGETSDFGKLGAEGREKIRNLVNGVMNRSRALATAQEIGARSLDKSKLKTKLGKVVVHDDEDDDAEDD